MQRTPVPARASRTQDYALLPDVEDDDAYYPQRPPSSTIRYVDTRGNQVIQRGQQRIVSSMTNHRPSGASTGRLF